MPLSAKQMEYLALAWQCFESEPKINYAKFATVAGLASPASARELMRVTKNKLRNEYGALSSTLQSSNNNGGANGTPQPRTPKRKIAGNTASGASATPASRKRSRKVLMETNDDEDQNGENGENEDEVAVSMPAEKKAKTKAKVSATPAAVAAGGVKVKSEFGLEEGFGEEVLAEEVSIF